MMGIITGLYYDYISLGWDGLFRLGMPLQAGSTKEAAIFKKWMYGKPEAPRWDSWSWQI
jgi:hypothetical protein